MKRASGCLFGMAFGDALGARTEFLNIDEILRRFPPFGPTDLDGDPALVTDDTQMAIAVGEALLSAPRPYSLETLEGPLRKAFVDWSRSPENDRSPGITCLTACARLEMGMPWQRATVSGSKGCGANMRVAPVGLIDVPDAERAAIAQFQAALTHGHPTGLAAADLTAAAVAALARGIDPGRLVSHLRDYALSQRLIYHGDWLPGLWERPMASESGEWIARGWDECLDRLDRVDTAMEFADRTSDPCYLTGAGWTAEEAFATGLFCFLLFPDDPQAAIKHAVVSSGDSDSIACITGAFAGAHAGLNAWPSDWVARIEYRDRLAAMGSAWDGPTAQ